MPIDAITNDADSRMQKTIEALRHELAKLRTGRAHTSLLDHVMVPYYGTETPLNQLASVTVSDPRTLTVQPWDKKSAQDVDKAIRNSDLGLNPVTAGDVIRVPLPALTEERRKEMIRVVRHEAEQARVAIRNVRRDANHHLKGLIKEESLAQDAEHRAEDEIQKLTDKYITQVDELLKEKEQDLMEI